MSPIDRLVQRSEAFSVLGISPTATQADVRKAYRKLAFDTHPDRHPENGSKFARIAEAYRYICDHAEELGIQKDEPQAGPTVARRVSRPQMRADETSFDDATIKECEALLEAQGSAGTQHIAAAIYRVGRNLTYFVRTPLAKGFNEVAVPTGMIQDARRVLPKIIAFDSRDAACGHFEMPADEVAADFPGARRIQIRFASA